MTIKEMYRDDLLNRYASHTFSETTVGDMTKVEFKNGSAEVIAEAKKMVVDDAYTSVRSSVDDNYVNAPCLTTTQIGALTNVRLATQVWNITDDKLQVYDGVAWKDMN